MMISRKAIVICGILFLGILTTAAGTIVTIEADDFNATDVTAHWTDPQWFSMHEPMEGVKLWRCDYRIPFEDALASRYPDIFAIASTNPAKPLGENVIGNPIPPQANGPVEDWWWDYWGGLNPFLLLEVDGLMKSITVYSITRPGWTVKTFMIDFYSPEGDQIGHNFTKSSVLTSNLGGYEAKYVMIWTTGCRSFDGITIDYQHIPEPATILILMAGTLFLRKRLYLKAS